MSESKLQVIANRMRASVAGRAFGWTQQTLPGGLDVVLSHNGEKWRLALRREKVFPSQVEMGILCDVFGVAEGTEPQRRQTCDVNEVTQRRIEWRCIEYNWREVEELAT